jgi:hypothetical protein
VLYINGWRFFFYSNEGNEPVHIHIQKGEKEYKYWLIEETFDIEQAFAYHMNNADKKEVRRIIFEHFDTLIKGWNEFFNRHE